jgi:hypothetical protein
MKQCKNCKWFEAKERACRWIEINGMPPLPHFLIGLNINVGKTFHPYILDKKEMVSNCQTFSGRYKE